MTATAGAAWRATRRAPHRYPSAVLPAPTGPRLRSALAEEHARDPFTPRDVRAAAARVRAVASELGVEADVVRGGVDVGGAELDHVWAVVVGHVVDVTMPLRSPAFADVLRAYVAGDVDDDELDAAAHGYAFEWRVVGEYPAGLRYVGLPVWGQREGLG
ncbi:MAG: hypothetical protein KY461_12210 [Actinobacteria bacterium]|nr:hypothetical protein [Actinomycetota bacterium]